MPVERVRTRSRAVERLCEIVRGLGTLRELAVMRTTEPAEAEDVIQRLWSNLPAGAGLSRQHRIVLGYPHHAGRGGPGLVGSADGTAEPAYRWVLVRLLAVAGSAAFCLQTAVLDALVWPALFKV